MESDKRLSALALPSDHPIGLRVSRAEGTWIVDRADARYLDLIAGLAVSPLGHGHPKVLKAIREHLDKHLHVMVYGEYVQEAQEDLAEKLTSLLPSPIDRAFFVNSGTEANEAAIKLAKAYTGRPKLHYFSGAYHGHTQGSLSISDHEARKRPFRPLLPAIDPLPFDNIEGLAAIDERTAAVILEPVQGDAGIRIPSQAFMSALREHCDRNGALLIFDEVQSGLGRSGEWWAFQHFGVQPDIVTSAKALGGGLPLGALLASDDLLRVFREDPPLGHLTSTGGHPLSCEAGSALISTLQEEGLLEKVEKIGARLGSCLEHPEVKSIRRMGGMIGLDLSDPEKAERFVQKAREKGVLLFGFLSRSQGVRIAPPFNMSSDELDEACQRLREALDAL